MGVSIGTALKMNGLLGEVRPVEVLVSDLLVGTMVASTLAVYLGAGSDCCRKYLRGFGSLGGDDEFGSAEWLLSSIFGISKRSRTASLIVNLSIYCWRILSASSCDRAFLYASCSSLSLFSLFWV